MDFNKLDRMIETMGESKQKVLIKAGLTPQGYYKMIRNKSMKIDALEKITRVLGLEMRVWWEESESMPMVTSEVPAIYIKNTENSELQLLRKIDRLRDLLDEKEIEISELKGIPYHKKKKKAV